MALSDATIIALNPWWTNPQWAGVDPHLEELRGRSVQLEAPAFVSSIEVGGRATHVVRGPRQVGKSTGLKLLAERAHQSGLDGRQLIYLALDLLEDQPLEEAARTITRAKQLSGAREPALVLLDEVTAVPKWAKAVKSVWDAGHTRRDTVVCTGSSAIDLVEGEVEGLPGRRGSGHDFLVLPHTFAEFARAVDPLMPESPRLSVAEIVADRALFESHLVYLPQLQQTLQLYLRFGGLPVAVIEAATGAREPSRETQRVVWDSISRELRKRGASETAVRALLERVVRSLGSKTNWSALAREMDVPLGGRKTPPDARSVRDYVELLGLCYETLVVYFWKQGTATNDLAKDKKIYFADPLLHHAVLQRTPGLTFDEPAAVENALAMGLYRSYEPFESQADGLANPSALHAWETASPKEIDFCCGPPNAPDLVEVKFRHNVRPADTVTMRRAFPGRPAILASKHTLTFDGDHISIPAAMLLWALG